MIYFNQNKKNFAFTLAEVLITLGIIGIVAEITIPSLYHDMQEQNYKIAYKKAYSTASQAWQSVMGDNMVEARTGWVSDISNYDNFTQFMAKFDTVKTCTQSTGFSDCWAPNEIANAGWAYPRNDGWQVCFLDKAGMAWCNAAGWGNIFVDTNGFKSPNKYGYDRFIFFLCVKDEHLTGPGCTNTPGTPNFLAPTQDWTIHDVNYCPSAPTHVCNYTSWLYN